MGTSWVAMFESAPVSTLPGCVLPKCEFQNRTKVSNWVPPKSRRVCISALSSSSPGEESGAGDRESNSSTSDGSLGSSDLGDSVSGSSFLPSRKQSAETEAEGNPKGNAALSALERAMAYKKMKGMGKPSSAQAQTKSSPVPVPPSNPVRVEVVAGKPIVSRKSSSLGLNLESTLASNSDVASSSGGDSGAGAQQGGGQSRVREPASSGLKSEEGQKDGSSAAQAAFEKAKAYKQQQSEMVAALNAAKEGESAAPEPETEEQEENVVEVEIYTRDGIVKRRVQKPETAFANAKTYKSKGVSTMDFMGLGFADKKSTSSRPAGLSEAFEAPTGLLPEVEIMTRDAGLADPDAMVEGEDVYKPKVTTWGMFPRPADISKAYGGGRNIKPGQMLETEEEKLARETKTKQLLDDYKKKLGLDMSPKDRARCERNMKEGENLMDRGQLKEAQVAFTTVMNEMPFPSELHGMAALQEAVCLDSLNRSDEAKVKYEKLVSHPNGAVRKKARQLLFGFQAAERLKVRAGYNWDSSSYRKYFDAFADGYNSMYKDSEKSETEEESLMQTLPYALLLIFPVILVFTLIALKNA